MILQFISVSVISFVFIGAKAFQQLNVMHDCRRLVPGFTAIMVICEVALIGNIAMEVTTDGWDGLALTMIAMTIGSSAGALLSMTLHKRMRNRKGK